MKAMSLKLKDNIYSDLESISASFKIPKNTYINEAIEYYNALKKRETIRKQLLKEVKICKESSEEVLKEFESIADNMEDEKWI